MTGAVIAAEIYDAYAEVGIAAGDGILEAVISRPGSPSGPSYAPTPGAPTDHTFRSKPVSVMDAQRAGMTLADGERVYSLVNHEVSIAPTTADALSIHGKTWSIVEVISKDSGGYVLTWLVKVMGPVG